MGHKSLATPRCGLVSLFHWTLYASCPTILERQTEDENIGTRYFQTSIAGPSDINHDLHFISSRHPTRYLADPLNLEVKVQDINHWPHETGSLTLHEQEHATRILLPCRVRILV